MQHKKFISNKGQSLIEVVVAISIISMILMALVSAVTFSMANSQYAKNKAVATKYAQEAVEFYRSMRDKNWAELNVRATDGVGRNICMIVPTYDTSSGGTCPYKICTRSDIIPNTPFIRQVNLFKPSLLNTNDKVFVKVTVSWRQGSRISSVDVNTILTRWQ